jgi:hypothetical protein
MGQRRISQIWLFSAFDKPSRIQAPMPLEQHPITLESVFQIRAATERPLKTANYAFDAAVKK